MRDFLGDHAVPLTKNHRHHKWQGAAFEDKARDKNFIPPGVRDAMRNAVENRAWPIVMLGSTGGGKTCAALCLIDHYGGWYTELSEINVLLAEARRGELWWDDSYGYRVKERELWDEWAGSNLCVLDEIALRAPTDAQFETLKKLLDRRENKPMVVISNFPMPDIVRVYDERIASRIAQGTVIEFSQDQRIG